jgi:hypothetical protein
VAEQSSAARTSPTLTQPPARRVNVRATERWGAVAERDPPPSLLGALNRAHGQTIARGDVGLCAASLDACRSDGSSERQLVAWAPDRTARHGDETPRRSVGRRLCEGVVRLA